MYYAHIPTAQHKLAQPIAVSGRLTRTATRVKPRLEYSAKPAAARGGDRSGVRALASPASGRAKRGASAREGAGMSANRRVHKSPRTSIDRGKREVKRERRGK